MNEAQIQFALSVSQTGIWSRDLLSNQLTWTDQCYALFGISPGEPVTYERFLAALHPDDRERIAAVIEQSLAEHAEYHTEYRVLWPDGSLRWLTGRGRGIYDAQGKPIQMIGTTMDVTELKQTEEALHESETRFRRFVDSNIVGITIDDLQGNIHEANDAFLSLVGYTRDDLGAGRLQWTKLTAPEFQERNARIVEDLLATGSFSPVETAYITRDGRRVPALVGGALFRQGGPDTLGISFILDLTARKAIEEQKDLFLGITSHELKTPLTALKGTLQLLQRRAERLKRTSNHNSPEEQAFLQELEHSLTSSLRQVDIQTRLINDLLDISRITSSTLDLSICRENLVSIVCQTVEDIRVTAPERSISLELPQGQEVFVQVDKGRISQALSNYVTNALRYSASDKPVQVGLTLREGKACVWVRDHGPGLTKEEQQSIWQRFHRGKKQEECGDTRKGLGLGLYIVRKLIVQHGGEVGVESVPGEGSTFWFTLPAVQNEQSR